MTFSPKTIAASLGNAVGSIAGRAPFVIRDLAGILAVAAISYGSWLAYAPAGFVAGGVLVLTGVVLSARSA